MNLVLHFPAGSGVDSGLWTMANLMIGPILVYMETWRGGALVTEPELVPDAASFLR